jgi:hypothetical protein
MAAMKFPDKVGYSGLGHDRDTAGIFRKTEIPPNLINLKVSEPSVGLGSFAKLEAFKRGSQCHRIRQLPRVKAVRYGCPPSLSPFVLRCGRSSPSSESK